MIGNQWLHQHNEIKQKCMLWKIANVHVIDHCMPFDYGNSVKLSHLSYCMSCQ